MKLFYDSVLSNKKQPLYDTAAFAMFLYEMVVELKPRLIFEIGVNRRGISTRAFLDAINTLSINDPAYHGQLQSLDILDFNETISKENPAYSHWKFVQADSYEYWKRFKEPIDILLIDGDHSYSSVKNDYDHYEPLVVDGGYILLHDTCDSKGVIKFWNSDYIKYPRIELRWQYGLGVIHKVKNYNKKI
jgi:cephalosporin hydroxylase